MGIIKPSCEKVLVVDYWQDIEISYLIRSRNLKELILEVLSVGV